MIKGFPHGLCLGHEICKFLLRVHASHFNHEFVDVLLQLLLIHFLEEHEPECFFHAAAHALEFKSSGQLDASEFVPLEFVDSLVCHDVSTLTLVVVEENLVRTRHQFHFVDYFEVFEDGEADRSEDCDAGEPAEHFDVDC